MRSKIGKSFRISDASSDMSAPERLVTIGFELLRQFHAAGGDDAPIDQDVHAVWSQLVEQPLIVRDEHDAQCRAIRLDLTDALRDDAQGIDVETGIGLVENGQLRFE